MPKSWSGKTLVWSYMAGYFIYVAAAGIKVPPQMLVTRVSGVL